MFNSRSCSRFVLWRCLRLKFRATLPLWLIHVWVNTLRVTVFTIMIAVIVCADIWSATIAFKGRRLTVKAQTAWTIIRLLFFGRRPFGHCFWFALDLSHNYRAVPRDVTPYALLDLQICPSDRGNVLRLQTIWSVLNSTKYFCRNFSINYTYQRLILCQKNKFSFHESPLLRLIDWLI